MANVQERLGKAKEWLHRTEQRWLNRVRSVTC